MATCFSRKVGTLSKLAAVGLALFVSACIFGVDASNGKNNSDPGESDVGTDSYDGPDGGPNGTDGSCDSVWFVDSDGDGYGNPNDTKTGTCDKPDGYVDNDRDCDDNNDAIHPEADEVCDGVDQNCNGTADKDESASNVAAEDCGEQEGVCAGATVAACTSDGSDYATCGADQYGDGYRDADDEGWRCDGTDNDCDGTSDEACCSSGANPTATLLGSDSDDQTHHAIAAPAPGASNDAMFVVAWATGQFLRIRHFDKTGSVIAKESADVGAPIDGVDIASHSDGYVAAVSTDQTSGIATDELYAYRFDASLTPQSPPKTAIQASSSNELLDSPSARATGSSVWIAYSLQDGSAHDIEATELDASNGDRATDAFQVSKSGNALPNSGQPEMAIVDGTPTVAWWQGKSGSLDAAVRGARLQSGGNVSDRFELQVKGQAAGATEPIGVTSGAGSLQVVYPAYSSGSGVLTLIDVAPGDTGSISGTTAISGNSKTNRQPSVLTVDADRDGTDDQIAVAWEQGSTSDPSIVVGSTTLSSPSKMSGRKVLEGMQGSGATRPEMTVFESRGGMVWQQPEVGSSRDTNYVPLSIDGVPVCTANP